jgi:transcriptional regulator with XRE-family HTH domain
MALSIAGKQITAARALADLTVAELAQRAGLSRDAIMKIEAGTVQPREGTIADITKALAAAGVEFTDKGARWIDDVIRVLDGEDAYLHMLDDVFHATRKGGGEVLFLCSDDRATRPGEEEAEERIRGVGVRFRSLIEAGNNFTRWPRKEYRQIPKEYFNHDLQVIYADRVAQMINGGEKILIIRNASLATTARNNFNLMWSLMRPLPKGKGDHG